MLPVPEARLTPRWLTRALLLAVPLVGVGCGVPLEALSPVTSQGGTINDLFNLALVLSTLVFLLVIGLLTYSLVRFRRRPGEALAAPSRVTGHRTLEVVWTAGPLLLVIVLFVLSVQTMRSVSAQDPGPAVLEVDVVGNRFWWEYRYPGAAEAPADDRDRQRTVTANELHLPVGTPVRLRLTSADVQHAFWVPRFGWKRDLYPGRTTFLPVEVQQPGTYDGVCAEYCGTQHAWMRIRVVAEPRAQFDAWLAELRRPAQAPTTPETQRGQQLFLTSTCVSCHSIRGTPAVGRVGPDLTHFGDRSLLGAGVAENTPESLYRWIRNAHELKPGVLMPGYTSFPEADLRALAAYLASLR